MKYTHIGWVPCINGHLDFGLMRPGISGGFTNSNVKDPRNNIINFSYTGTPDYHARKIILQSKVDWLDSRSSEKYDGSFRVFVLSEVSESNHLDNRDLSGSIYIYRQSDIEESREANYRIDIFKVIHDAQGHYEDWVKYKDKISWDKIQSDLNFYYDKEKRLLDYNSENKKGFWRVDFNIKPNGLVYMDFSSILKKGYTERESYIVARQAYYYLKYSLHSHKHHDHQTDSLTTLVPIVKDCKQSVEEAGLKIIGQLKRELTNIKRTLNDNTIKDVSVAIGVISYIKSLLQTLSSDKILPVDLIVREIGYFQSLEDSFLVRENRNKNFRMIRIETINSSRVLMGWFLAVVVALFSFYTGLYFSQESNQIESGFYSYPLNGFIIFFIFLVVSFFSYNKLANYAVSLNLESAGFNDLARSKYNNNFFEIVFYNFKSLIKNYGVVFIFFTPILYFLYS